MSDPFDFRQNLCVEIESSVIKTVFVKLTIRKLIGRLEFVIIGHIFLNSVIRQMNTLRNLRCCKFFRSCTNIALFVHIKFKSLIDLYSKHIAANVKFSFLVQQGINILLQEVSFVFSFRRMKQQIV